MTTGQHLSTIILAAGKGTRMRSDQAKVLHPLCGEPLLAYPLKLARAIRSDRIVVVVGHQAETVRRAFPFSDIIFVEQNPQLGTGHAVLQAKEAFSDYTGTILILCGDVPCLQAATALALIRHHRRERAAVTVMTTLLEDPGTYGRVITAPDGNVLKIVEARDATERQQEIREVNTGIYCADGSVLFEAVSRIGNDNSQKEYYLTDIIEIVGGMGLRVRSFVAADPREVMGVNTLQDLDQARDHLSCR